MQSNKSFTLSASDATRHQSRSFLFPNALLEALPSSLKQQSFVAESRQTIINILAGVDPRVILVLGPCSIHNVESALEYAEKLKQISLDSNAFFLVMRTYFEKARTAVGWKGLAFDPHLDGSNGVPSGLYLSRQLLLSLAEMGVPAATEFLDPTSGLYFDDLISWGCIGARTSESQLHRQMASGLTMPVAFKNNTSGNIEAAINGIISASHPHRFMGINKAGILEIMNTEGNPWGHLVLRGGADKPNYESASIEQAILLLRQADLPPALFVDCSHDNACKMHEKQPAVFESVVHQISEGNRHIRGICLESHLNAGNQPLSNQPGDLKYGVSVTDACIDWETTRALIKWGNGMLKQVCLFLLLLTVFSGCVREKLSAFSEYVNREDLASYLVGTPDPSLNYPTVGQRLYIHWDLPKEYAGQELMLKLTMRFRDKSEIVQPVELYQLFGTYVFELLNDDFFDRQGFLTYKIELFADQEPIEKWCHQMWVELITFNT
jgi:3-deoxy-7-phosphoheptulonate synthase